MMRPPPHITHMYTMIRPIKFLMDYGDGDSKAFIVLDEGVIGWPSLDEAREIAKASRAGGIWRFKNA